MNQADTAWMLVSTALVLLMTPALAFFYGGLVRSKNALNTMMMSFISLGFVGVMWAVIGYSLAFSAGNNYLGDMSRLFLRGVGLEAQGSIPHYLFMAYQGTFCIINGALISARSSSGMLFRLSHFHRPLGVGLYSPWRTGLGGGWLADMGALVSRAAPSSTQRGRRSAGSGARCRETERLPKLVAAAAQRAVHAARRRSAVVRLVRLQRRKRARRKPNRRAGVRNDVPRADGHPRGLDAAGLRQVGPADRGGRRDGDRRRPGGNHTRGRLRRADERDRARRDCRGSELLWTHLAGQDLTGRLARRCRRARGRRNGRRPVDGRVCAEGAERHC